MKRFELALAATFLVAMVGCNETKSGEAAVAASAVPAAVPAAPAAPAAEPATVPDFEEEAMTQITPQNADMELAKLEAEVKQ